MSQLPSAEFLDLQAALKGRYSIERELGRGGMGIVYLAQEVALDRPVALKLLPPEMAVQERLRERFLREARTAAKLSHPNIVPIFSVDEVEGFVFFAMAYIDGQTLGERIRSRGPVPAGEAAKVLREVAWALAYAHGQGVVHRDVKPDNILLETESGRALVTDFGIAHLGHEEGITSSGEVLGTAEVMSPEQASGEDIDARSDIYSLGAVGFYALTGRFPFEGSNVSQILAKQISQPAPPVASEAPEVPASLARAVDRCLRKEPEQRFPDGAALAEALGQGVRVQRELPVPLRVYLKRLRQTGRSSAAFMLFGLYLTMGILGALTESLGLGLALIPVIVVLALTLLGPLGVAAYHTRKLLKSGYDLADAQLALRQDVERRTEEMTFEYGPYPARLDTVLKWSGLGGLGLAAGFAVLLSWSAVTGISLPWGGLLGTVFGTSLAAGGIASIGWLGRRNRRKDVFGEAWLKRLQGRIGRWLFGTASVGLRLPAASGSSGFRPTELAIGMAADRLFEDLPKETKRELAGLPDAIRKLESDAQKMRKQVDDLSDVLAEIGDDPARAGSDERARLREDVESTRDEAQRRMTEAVSALESIRLGLLRLHAGAGSVESMTADLTAALDLSRDIERLSDSHDEVNRLLQGRKSGVPTADRPTTGSTTEP